MVLVFTVRNETYSMEFNLFQASHRLDQGYPVVIDPPSSDIPEFLRRERYVPGKPALSSIMHPLGVNLEEAMKGTPGRYEENEWVSGERKAGQGAESGTGERKAGQVRYWQYGQAEESPNLAISDLSRFPLPVPLPRR